jgi:diguanylate cyclase
MMNDENFYNSESIREEWHHNLSQDDPHRSGIQFARRVRLARMVGLGRCFSPFGRSGNPFLSGGWWLLLVGWAFVWPHLAWQLACRSPTRLTVKCIT